MPGFDKLIGLKHKHIRFLLLHIVLAELFGRFAWWIVLFFTTFSFKASHHAHPLGFGFYCIASGHCYRL